MVNRLVTFHEIIKIDYYPACPGETKNDEARTIYMDEELLKKMKALHSNRRLGCPYIFHQAYPDSQAGTEMVTKRLHSGQNVVSLEAQANGEAREISKKELAPLA